ncbi:MAG: ABC transporter ATP-binding protein [Ruminococcaceae bacterium]|nr:ABC transporter ATP-binding protein [Oscillospiraceae bacterium]
MIRAENITKYFDDVRSLHEVSMTAGDGSIFGLIGSNGSGKSTLLRILSGIYQPDTGDIFYDGAPVFENTAVKNKLVYLSDDPYFLPHCTMNDMRDFYASVYPEFDRERYESLTKQFGLNPRRRIVTFSKGMQKQVSMLLGLACRPKYLFCDETFDGLDPVMRQLVKSLIIADVAERDLCCVVASHNLREMEDMADHIALLHRGELLFEKELDDIRTNMVKVQVSYRKEICDDMAEKLRELQPMTLERRGSLFTLIVRGTEESLQQWFRETSPLFCEYIPMTLEEIFITEMEERGYEFTSQILG